MEWIEWKMSETEIAEDTFYSEMKTDYWEKNNKKVWSYMFLMGNNNEQ